MTDWIKETFSHHVHLICFQVGELLSFRETFAKLSAKLVANDREDWLVVLDPLASFFR